MPEVMPEMPGSMDALLPELSAAEMACLGESSSQLMLMLATPDLVTPEEQAEILGCLEDETVLGLFLAGLVGQTGELSAETMACISQGTQSIDLRSAMLGGLAGAEQAAMVSGMSALILTLGCLSDEEFETLAPSMGMTAADREGLQCVTDELGGPEGVVATLESGGEAAFMAFFGVAMACDLQLQNLAPGG